MNKPSIFKDKSVIWAVVLLIIVIFLLQYIKSTSPASAEVNFFGASVDTSVIPIPTGTDKDTYYYCNTCGATTRDGVKTWFCERTKFSSPCQDRCESADDCGSSGGSDGSGGSGGDGGDTQPGSPSPSAPSGGDDGKHYECTGVIYGYTSYCRLVSGEGEDQCSGHDECRRQNPAYENHTECRNGQCVIVAGHGINQCTYYTDCSSTNQSATRTGPIQAISNFFQKLWFSIVALFSR